MALFRISENQAKKLPATDVDLEKTVQKLFEGNLEEILNITFLATEYSTSFGGRIDTLGIDKNGSPVIIEYKKSQNDNVINQGLSYLKWLLDHKADFEALCQKNNVKVEIDWTSPRVICIALSYNKFDLDAIDFLPITVELLKYRLYEDGLLNVEADNYQKIKVSTSSIVKKTITDRDSKPQLQKTYTLEEHLSKANPNVKKIFMMLREKVTALDENIIEEPKKMYVAYKLATNFIDIHFRQSSLIVTLNVKSGDLNDPTGIARDLANPKHIGHWGNGDYDVKVDNEKVLEPLFGLIQQSYNYNK